MRKRQLRQWEKLGRELIELDRELQEASNERWALLSDVPSGETGVEDAPVTVEWLNGRQLSEPAGACLFITDQAAYVAVTTWSASREPGSNTTFLETHRIPFDQMRQVQVAQGAICFWESDDGTLPESGVKWDANKVRFTALAVPPPQAFGLPFPGLQLMKAVDQLTRHLPAERRLVPPTDGPDGQA